MWTLVLIRDIFCVKEAATYEFSGLREHRTDPEAVHTIGTRMQEEEWGQDGAKGVRQNLRNERFHVSEPLFQDINRSQLAEVIV